MQDYIVLRKPRDYTQGRIKEKYPVSSPTIFQRRFLLTSSGVFALLRDTPLREKSSECENRVFSRHRGNFIPRFGLV